MNKNEARAVLKAELEKYRKRSYESLTELLDQLDAYEVQGPSGVTYQLEIQAVWDGEPNSHLRVMGGIDDGGLRSAFSPLTEDFILTPEGDFVVE